MIIITACSYIASALEIKYNVYSHKVCSIRFFWIGKNTIHTVRMMQGVHCSLVQKFDIHVKWVGGSKRDCQLSCVFID